MAPDLQLGLSPCPNDTFIFHALLHGRVKPPSARAMRFTPAFADVQKLNEQALAGSLPVTKVSAGVLPHILDKYRILDSGAALGWGCGPVVVAKKGTPPTAASRVAIPGRHTTAAMLLDLHGAYQGERMEMRFDRIMPALANAEADVGVLIHEGRFTYSDAGLIKLIDLGQWWEEQFHMPLPLGVIVVRRDVDEPEAIAAAIAASVDHAWQNPLESRAFIREHAQELEPAVIEAHIRTFVTDFSRNLGPQGRQAVLRLLGSQTPAGQRLTEADIFVSI